MRPHLPVPWRRLSELTIASVPLYPCTSSLAIIIPGCIVRCILVFFPFPPSQVPVPQSFLPSLRPSTIPEIPENDSQPSRTACFAHCRSALNKT